VGERDPERTAIGGSGLRAVTLIKVSSTLVPSSIARPIS
jgi:hypothetical protein